MPIYLRLKQAKKVISIELHFFVLNLKPTRERWIIDRTWLYSVDKANQKIQDGSSEERDVEGDNDVVDVSQMLSCFNDKLIDEES